MTSEEAVKNILEELKQLVVLRENKFQDHVTKNKKKVKAAFRYLSDYNIVLSIIYLIILAVGIDYKCLFGQS